MSGDPAAVAQLFRDLEALVSRGSQPVSHSRSIKSYYSQAANLRQQAEKYQAEDRIEEAYVFWKRFVVLFVKVIGAHNAYNSKQFQPEQMEYRRHCASALDQLELIKPMIRDLYEKIVSGQAEIDEPAEEEVQVGPTPKHAEEKSDAAMPTVKATSIPPMVAATAIGAAVGVATATAVATGAATGAATVGMAGASMAASGASLGASMVASAVRPAAGATASAAATGPDPWANLRLPSPSATPSPKRGVPHTHSHGAPPAAVGRGVPLAVTRPMAGGPTPQPPPSVYQPQGNGGYAPQYGAPAPTMGYATPPTAGRAATGVGRGAGGYATTGGYAPQQPSVPGRGPMPVAYATPIGHAPTSVGLPPRPAVSAETAAAIAPAQPKKPSAAASAAVRSSLRNIGRLRPIHVPGSLINEFLKIASPNTRADIETCAILTGKLHQGQLVVTTLVIPKQHATSNTCVTQSEEQLFDLQDKNGLMTLGWIHTHPTQECFLSSVDLHTHFSYQLMMPEAIAIVCAPTAQPNCGIFALSPQGLDVLSSCSLGGFHRHSVNEGLYGAAGHVVYDANHQLPCTYVDLR